MAVMVAILSPPTTPLGLRSLSSARNMTKDERAEMLKEDGNTLFQQGQWRLASRKYSEAIKEDPKNATYYANRAACCLKLKEYIDASADAKKAIELDPRYAKAWSRLATAQCALGGWVPGIASWEKALSCLPEEGHMNEAEKRWAADFRRELVNARSAQEAFIQSPFIIRTQDERMPWERAKELMNQLLGQPKISSGFIIYQAYEDFKNGIEIMKDTNRYTMNGRTAWHGQPDALTYISSGLMRDPRVMHIDSNDWTQKLGSQMAFESQAYNAWYHGGPKVVIDDIPKRLKKGGWVNVRNALATQIRVWVICGGFSMEMRKYSAAVEYHSRSLEVLRWVDRTYSDVPVATRGIVFTTTFMRGVAYLQLLAIHADMAMDKSSTYAIDNLKGKCIDLISDITLKPAPPQFAPSDPASYSSYWVYPHAEALAILGWCCIQRAKGALELEEATTAFSEAASYYDKACALLPDDEEKPWGETKKILHKTLSAGEKMLKIWENSSNEKDRDTQLAACRDFLDSGLKAEEQGYVTDSTILKPGLWADRDQFPSPFSVYL